MLSAAHSFGLLNNVSGWLAFGFYGNTYWSDALGQLGILSGNNLSWAGATEAFTRASLPRFSLQVSIALLYLSWIVIGWAQRTPRERSQLLES
jgi:hypothetical protein